ncbi:MAG: hypothetical protein K2Y51_23470 [Gammaproteobacteria bacterium]|jgi:hypothetical protein|nr:hypothetical protein [Gammaproteobacteria bacterium]
MHEQPVHIFINKIKFSLNEAEQTGASLKQVAGIPLSDVLFLQRPGDDEVIANGATISVKNGDHFHSQPPADYGLGPDMELLKAGLAPDRVTVIQEAGGWQFLVIKDYQLPGGFEPSSVKLLLKLPPGFPDAAPDMFWVYPAVRTPTGSLPRATSDENLLGEIWQRFSWHLAAGSWKPGSSNLRDFLRCVASRFLRMD